MLPSVKYYKDLFPHDQVMNLVSLRTNNSPENREFSCEWNAEGGAIWQRYFSCCTAADLQSLVSRKNLKAIHIGPCFSEAAKYARSTGVYVTGKELVFDMDLQDVAFFGVDRDDQRKNDRYVKAVFASCAVLIEILKEVFALEHFLPVYSGRRGVHLWVLDERAYGWGDDVRTAVCEFVSAFPSKRDPRVINTYHILSNPSFGSKTWDAVENAQKCVLFAHKKEGGVGLFDKPREVNQFLEKLFELDDGLSKSEFEQYRKRMQEYAKLAMNGYSGWDAYQQLSSALEHESPFYFNRLKNIVLSMCWPTLDVGATSKANHCTKSVFSLHAKSGRIAVPVRSLYSTKEYMLPPIVMPDEINDAGGTVSSRLFADGLALLEEVTKAASTRSRATTATFGGVSDIEDLVNDAPKRRRSGVSKSATPRKV